MTSTGFENLREAINDKNKVWFSRYRTVDGYNVYGGRSKEAYAVRASGQIQDRNPEPPYVSNFQVMQREMSQRDVMTANRDKRVWARAQGRRPRGEGRQSAAADRSAEQQAGRESRRLACVSSAARTRCST